MSALESWGTTPTVVCTLTAARGGIVARRPHLIVVDGRVGEATRLELQHLTLANRQVAQADPHSNGIATEVSLEPELSPPTLLVLGLSPRGIAANGTSSTDSASTVVQLEKPVNSSALHQAVEFALVDSGRWPRLAPEEELDRYLDDRENRGRTDATPRQVAGLLSTPATTRLRRAPRRVGWAVAALVVASMALWLACQPQFVPNALSLAP